MIMVDELFDRHYREGRAELNASITGGLSKFGKGLKDVFEVLVGIEYQAPWARPSSHAHSK